MPVKSIAAGLSIALLAGGAATAQQPEGPRIASWSNSSSADQKTVFQVKPGEKITFSVKAEGAEKFAWLVNGKVQEAANAASFKWTAPNKKGMWKILVKSTNRAIEEKAEQQKDVFKQWPGGRGDKKENFIRGVTELKRYPEKARKEWIVSAFVEGGKPGGPKDKPAALRPVGPVSTTGWESEKYLAGGLPRGERFGSGGAEFTPAIAFDVMGDGKWILISGDWYGTFHGCYWDGKKWVKDNSRIVKGLEDIGGGATPTIISNLTGDRKWTLIGRNGGGKFFGWYWDGAAKKWVSAPARVKGLGEGGGRCGRTALHNLKGRKKWTLICGHDDGTFKGYCWNGSKWIEDSSRVAGLGDVGRRAKPTVAFNVFGDKKWTLITGNDTGFKGFYWGGAKWVPDDSRAAGLGDGSKYGNDTAPAIAHDLLGDGKWALIGGYEQGGRRGFLLNTVSRGQIPSIKEEVTCILTPTVARIQWKYDKTWNHRVRYSTKKDMSDAVWSEWREDTDRPHVRLKQLIPETTYYYEVYTYVPWDMNAYAKTTIGSLITPSSQGYIKVKQGQSIQDAIDSLAPEGGIIELLPGTHNVHKTIVIDRGNVVIYGTDRSVVKHHNKGQDVFVIPHENPGYTEDWKNLPALENITFKGFKIASDSLDGGLLLTWNANNITLEDIIDESHLRRCIIKVNPSGSSSAARSENIFLRNNTLLHSSITFARAKNVHVIGNNLAANVVDINRDNFCVYIKNNTIRGQYSMNIRAHSGRDVWIEGNRLLGGVSTGICFDGVTDAIVSNNTITRCRRAAIQIDPQPPLRIKIINNLIYNNPGSGVITTEHSGHRNTVVDLANNIICNNGGHGIDMKVNWVRFRIMANNIITGNKGYGINYIETFEPTIIKYNNVWNNAKGNYHNTSPGTGDISADPLFVDPAKGDFHIRSKAGRWGPKAKKWVKDKVNSPCIDAGDPKTDFAREPAPNGKRVNMGAYGNTSEASKTTVR